MNIYDIEWKYYDFLYGDYVQDIHMYNRLIKKGRVLELMCGTGRVCLNLKNAEEIVCLDIDERMLEQAKRKSSGKNVKFIQGDVLKSDIDGKFDFIIIALNSILLFNNREKKILLKKIKKNLTENGKIIIDTVLPPEFVENVVYLGDHKKGKNLEIWRFFVPEFSEDMKTLYLTYIYDIIEEGKLRRESAVLTLYPVSYDDMEEIAKDSGLKIDNVYGSYSFDKFDPVKSERMILLMGLK